MTLPDKKQLFVTLLQDGWVSVGFDGRADGVIMPPRFREQARVILQYGLDMPVPIPDLEATDAGISATLSFQRVAEATFVPWSAIFVIARDDGSGIFFEKDAPADLAETLREEKGTPPQRKRLRSVPDSAPTTAAGSGEDELPPEPTPPPRKAPALRLVK